MLYANSDSAVWNASVSSSDGRQESGGGADFTTNRRTSDERVEIDYAQASRNLFGIESESELQA